ncbi:MAG: D-glycero-beta-D-manno-heptose 1-phosphate adenylyltransferase [Candidatus Cloacimonetes bacterium]|nr:D-glycero-beta-D-manno-heptose 1-phosphate adenylyltransferase [Candidatus Cloacimonadota bacterium]
MTDKIITADELARWLADRGEKRVVFTNGCFDILHAGHVQYLEEAAALGDILVLGLNTDAGVRGLKGPQRPVVPQRQRAAVLAGLASVDWVVLFDEPTPARLIEQLRPDVLVKGGDWRPEQIVGADTVLAGGGEVHSLRFLPGVSSSAIITRICKIYGEQHEL